MADYFSFWALMPMVASLVAAALVFAVAALAAKRFGPFRSSLPAAIAVTVAVLVVGTIVYVPMQSFASREENIATKDVWMLVSEGDLAGAETKIQRQIKALRNRDGAVLPVRIEHTLALVHVRKAQGRFEEAERLCLDTLQLIRPKLAEHDYLYYNCMYETMRLYLERGDVGSAKRLGNEALKAVAAAIDSPNRVQIMLLDQLARCCRREDDFEAAARYYEKALAAIVELQVTGYAYIGTDYGEMLMSQGKAEAAAAVFERVTRLQNGEPLT